MKQASDDFNTGEEEQEDERRDVTAPDFARVYRRKSALPGDYGDALRWRLIFTGIDIC
jgi:hypothetical protein